MQICFQKERAASCPKYKKGKFWKHTENKRAVFRPLQAPYTRTEQGRDHPHQRIHRHKGKGAFGKGWGETSVWGVGKPESVQTFPSGKNPTPKPKGKEFQMCQNERQREKIFSHLFTPGEREFPLGQRASHHTPPPMLPPGDGPLKKSISRLPQFPKGTPPVKIYILPGRGIARLRPGGCSITPNLRKGTAPGNLQHLKKCPDSPPFRISLWKGRMSEDEEPSKRLCVGKRHGR
ncbi:hypothetical protein HNY73_018818 [Argiope bruennichi]|uniref:Uncharacterized protein n=1 Tax=Argiope bruennichi TaxID=94029 RepID=A0A8T0EE82_ARGBR|nr:hypothetical protein HNY73_018818 [Argiope bruennichi]